MSFNDRSIRHENYCKEVVGLLKEYGCRVIAFGVEHRFPRESRLLLLEFRDRPLSKFARFVPDYILIHRQHLVFFDVKSPSPKWNTIAIELDAFDTYKLLADMGMPVFIVGRDLQCFWATEIRYSRKITDPAKLRGNEGSGTPFGVVDENSTPMHPLALFLKDLRD